MSTCMQHRDLEYLRLILIVSSEAEQEPEMFINIYFLSAYFVNCESFALIS